MRRHYYNKLIIIVLSLILLFLVYFVIINLMSATRSFCGDGACSLSEDCSSCFEDCGCGSDRVCVEGKCIVDYMQVSNFSFCYNQFNIEYTSKNYEKALDLSLKCRLEVAKELDNIALLKKKVNGKEEHRMLELNELVYKSNDAYLNYLYLKIRDIDINPHIYKTTSERKAAVISALGESLPYLENSIYYFYAIKNKYPLFYRDQLDKLFKQRISDYEKNNLELNKLYDFFGDYNYKFFLQINPLNPLVIEETDRLVEGLKGDELKIKTTLIKFVRNNVDYVYSTNWQTNWVNPPAVTLMKGKGQCTDSSVLLASMFVRAGIENVGLCVVDTETKGADHLVVGIKKDSAYELWDPTCITCDDKPVPSSASKWNYTCFDIGQYKSKELQRCGDDTIYDNCSTTQPYFCDNGHLIPRCNECGCPLGLSCFKDNKCYKCSAGFSFKNGECRKD